MYSVCGQGSLYKDPRFMAAFPSICLNAEGELVLLFRRAPDSRWLLESHYDQEKLAELTDVNLRETLYHWDPRSQLVSLRFDQDLKRVAGPQGLSIDPQAADQDASLLLLSDGTILLFSFSWYAMPPGFASLVTAWGGQAYGGPKNTGCTYIPWGSYVRRSEDGGRTWSERQYLPALEDGPDLVPGLRSSHGGGCRGQAVSRESEIIVPSYALVEKVSTRYSAHVFASSDGGQSWRYQSVMARDQSGKLGFYEPSLCLCEDGSIVAYLRTDDARDRMASTRSTDGGRSWSDFQLHEAIGHPAHALRLRDGRLLLSYGYRHTGYGVRARVLNAQGSDVDSAEEIVLRDDGLCTDLGYPWAQELDDGRVIVAYYYTEADGIRHIAYSLLSQ